MTQENMELIIDDEDTYLELDNVFYVHPSRIGSLSIYLIINLYQLL